MRFRDFVYWDVSFSKNYHSLSLELRWKSYELSSEVIKNYLWVGEDELWEAIKVG